MRAYEYSVIRFRPHVTLGEFVNIGVMVKAMENSDLEIRITDKLDRAVKLFPSIEKAFWKAMFKEIEGLVKSSATVEGPNLEKAWRKIVPSDDQSIIATPSNKILFSEEENALELLYHEYVGLHENKLPKKRKKASSRIIKSFYNSLFEEKGIASKLEKNKEIDLEHTKISFDHYWLNGKPHVYQNLPLDGGSSKDKLLQWGGKLNVLKNESKDMNLAFLTKRETTENELLELANDTLLVGKENGLSVRIVKEEEALSFAEEVAKEIRKSESI